MAGLVAGAGMRPVRVYQTVKHAHCVLHYFHEARSVSVAIHPLAT
jgi:hypothetical protein